MDKPFLKARYYTFSIILNLSAQIKEYVPQLFNKISNKP